MSLDVMRIGKVAHAGIALLYAYLLQPEDMDSLKCLAGSLVYPTALTESSMQGQHPFSEFCAYSTRVIQNLTGNQSPESGRHQANDREIQG